MPTLGCATDSSSTILYLRKVLNTETSRINVMYMAIIITIKSQYNNLKKKSYNSLLPFKDSVMKYSARGKLFCMVFAYFIIKGSKTLYIDGKI